LSSPSARVRSKSVSEGALPEEERLRAEFYALLARLLAAPPEAELLSRLGGLPEEPATELGAALASLCRLARNASPSDLEDEFNALFSGLGASAIVPYASYYKTGFLHEKPLALLRADLARLGVGLSEGTAESEDHIACLCEAMAALILGSFSPSLPLAGQQSFFDAHLAHWAERLMEDLERCELSPFYAAVGQVGRVFLAIEAEAWRLAA
jgi:TorA maturation chaperone TorD